MAAVVTDCLYRMFALFGEYKPATRLLFALDFMMILNDRQYLTDDYAVLRMKYVVLHFLCYFPFQADFPVDYLISGVIIAGDGSAGFVQSFYVGSSFNGRAWTMYKSESGSRKVIYV